MTAPGAPIAGSDEGARALARAANEYCAALRDKNPQRFGFFAALPNALDTAGTLAEIAYALDHLKADGVTLFTRYGDGNYYLGHEKIAPIWTELNARQAIVFIHPTHPADTNRVNPSLLQPTLDYPHETTRTTVDLLMSNTRKRNPNCKIILSHAGGTLPWIFSRFTTSLRGLPREKTPHGKTYEEYVEELRSFYYDLAGSCSHQVLDLVLQMIPDDHILYGEDTFFEEFSLVILIKSCCRCGLTPTITQGPTFPTLHQQPSRTSVQILNHIPCQQKLGTRFIGKTRNHLFRGSAKSKQSCD